jgi:hypothetical protein
MASTYSTNLAIELIANGEQTGTWGSTTNSNLGTLIEQAISGYVTQAVSTGTDTTITIPNGTTGVARNMFIELTGTGGASTNLIVPANKKLYFIYNNTSSGQVTVKVSGLTGISVANGTKVVLVSNGTDIVSAASYTISNSAVTFSSITDSGLTATRVTYAGTAGLLQDSANLTFNGTSLNLVGNLLANGGTVQVRTGGQFYAYNSDDTNYAVFYNTGATGAGNGVLSTQISGTSGATALSGAGFAVTGTLSSTLDATIYGVTVGRGGGAVASNTAVGYRSLLSISVGTGNVAVGFEAIYINNASSSSAVGYQALRASSGSANTALGYQALVLNSTASNNTAVGYQAGYSNTTGTENLFAGYRAGYLATGSYAVSIGNEAGYSNTDVTSGNVFVGYQSGRANTSGAAVVAIGTGSLLANTTGSYNTAIGRSSLQANTTASNNTAVGYLAANTTTTGGSNTAIGFQSFLGNTTGADNTAIGRDTLRSNTTADGNLAVGGYALYTNTTGASNSAVGINSLFSTTTGGSNAAVGYGSLQYNTTGSANVAMGYQVAYSSTAATNNTILGYQAGYTGTTESNNVMIGKSAGFAATTNTSVLIGVEAGFNSAGNSNTAVGFNAYAWNSSSSTCAGGCAFGYEALRDNTSGNGNVAMGYQAGKGITTGASNVYIGYLATQSSVSVSSEIVVGPSITGKGANTAFIGGTSGAYNGANTTTWSVTSDIRIKKNVASLASGLDVVQALRPVEFDYIENNKHDIGFIAQEYQTVLPAQVVEGADGMLSLNQNLVPYLVKAIQELKARLDAANL